jgi:hypothetical protein
MANTAVRAAQVAAMIMKGPKIAPQSAFMKLRRRLIDGLRRLRTNLRTLETIHAHFAGLRLY